MAASAIRTDIFTWSGTDKSGRPGKGEITAISQAMARAQLRQQGIKPNNVRKKPKPLFGGKGKAIKPADIAIFTRQLATMLKAGVPLVQSFDIVADGLEKPQMKASGRQHSEMFLLVVVLPRHCATIPVSLTIYFVV